MEEAEAAFRKKRNFMILNAIGGRLLTRFEPEEPLILGEEFAVRSKTIFESLDSRRRRLIQHLNDLPLERLEADFSPRGSPVSPAQKEWFEREKVSIRVYARTLSVWDRAQFDRANELADFGYWSKAAYLTVSEAVLLSVGLKPSPAFVKELEGSGRGRLDPVTEFLRLRRTLFRRGLDPQGIDSKFSRTEILRWISDADLEVHPGFRRMSETNEQTEKGISTGSVQPQPAESARIDPREKTSMAKLLVLMAIDAYGYQPRSKRSPIPNEIEGLAQRHGVDLTAQTIRSYLRLGEEQLPADWSND